MQSAESLDLFDFDQRQVLARMDRLPKVAVSNYAHRRLNFSPLEKDLGCAAVRTNEYAFNHWWNSPQCLTFEMRGLTRLAGARPLD